MAWDWVPTAATAGVAVAGYVATWAATRQQASSEIDKLRLSHRQELEVARRQERREVYAQFLKSNYAVVHAIGQVAGKLPPLEADTANEVNQAISEMQALSYEVMLIADGFVLQLVDKLTTEVLLVWGDVMTESREGKRPPPTLSKTAGLMHRELLKAMSKELLTSQDNLQ